MFPFGKSSPLFVYDIQRASGALGPFEATRLRDLVHERFASARVPPTLDSSEEYTWAWAWFDDKSPVTVGPWVAWLVRAWVKKPPKSLLEALLDQAIDRKRIDDPAFKITSEWREEQRDELAKTLRIRQPPKIEETPVAFDIVNGRVLLFTSNKRTRDAMLARLAHMLEPMLGDGIVFVPWNLTEYLTASRPAAVLPQEIGEKFASWLSTQALHYRGLDASLYETTEPTHVDLELDASMCAATADGDITVKGERAVQAVASDVEDPEQDFRTSKVTVYLRHKGGRDYGLTVDTDGYLQGCRLAGAEAYAAKEDNLEVAVFDRCADYLKAATLLRLLYGAFDFGPLTGWMEAQPQRQLFPGSPTGYFVWTEGSKKEDEEEAKPEIPRGPGMGPVFDASDDATTAAMARPLVMGAECLNRAMAHGFDAKAVAAFRAVEGVEDQLVQWYVDGGWPRVLVGMSERGVKNAPSGGTTIRRPGKLPEETAPVDYEAQWETMLVEWREKVGDGAGLNLKDAQTKTGSLGNRRKLVDAFLGGGWDLVVTTLVAMGVPWKKGRGGGQ